MSKNKKDENTEIEIKEKDDKEEEEDNGCERQISITSGAHQIQMVTNDPEEDMDYLLDRCLIALAYCKDIESTEDKYDYC